MTESIRYFPHVTLQDAISFPFIRNFTSKLLEVFELLLVLMSLMGVFAVL